MVKQGKCSFNDAWLTDSEYNKWLAKVPGNPYSFRCRWCAKDNGLGNMGKTALKAHARGAKHKERQMEESKISYKLPACFAVITNSEITTNQQSQPKQDFFQDNVQPEIQKNIVQVASSSDTLRCEILWVLRTVYLHEPYSSNDDIDKYFRAMFQDSENASQFSCGQDKTGYLVRFGLGPYFKKQLLMKIGTKDFVLLFDETLNKKQKRKQMDIYVRFWSEDKEGQPIIKSHYLGSAFMGHAKAVDMLHHFKVS